MYKLFYLTLLLAGLLLNIYGMLYLSEAREDPRGCVEIGDETRCRDDLETMLEAEEHTVVALHGVIASVTGTLLWVVMAIVGIGRQLNTRHEESRKLIMHGLKLYKDQQRR